MNNNGGAISFDALINNSQFLKSFQEMEERIKGFTNKAAAEAEKTDTVFSKLGKAIENTFTSDNLREVAQQIIKVRGEFQALEGSLKVMLGSKEKADELMTQVADLAAKTPLSLTQVGESAKLMVAYGFSTNTVIGHLQMLGDVAHGVNMPIEDLVNTFGAIRTNGVASLSDIEGMAGKGIPIFEVLGNVLNTNRDGVEKMVEASKVGLPQIELAFQSMTSTGGMFSGVMKEQAKSVDALMTNLEESINRVYNEIGKDTDGLVAGTLQMGVSMLENYQSIAKIIEVLAIAYGAYKAALLVVNATEAAAIAIKGGWTIATLAEYQALLLVEKGQKLLNATMLNNPYVLATTLIIGLTAAILLNKKEAIELKSANDLLKDSLKEAKNNFQAEGEEIKTNIKILQDKNVADSVREQAYKRINELSPKLLQGMSLEEAKIKDLTLATRTYIAELDKKIQLEGNSSALIQGIKQRNDLQQVYDDIEAEYKKMLDRVNALKKNKSVANDHILYGVDGYGLVDDLKQLKKELDAAKIKLQESKDEIEKLNKNRVNIYANDPALNALKATIEGEKIRLKGIKNNLSPEYKQLEDSIKKHQKELDSLQNTNKPSNTVVKNKSYWDEELKRRQEDFYKVEKGAKNYGKLRASVIEAEKELEKYKTSASNGGGNSTDKAPQVDEKLKGTIAYYDQIIARSRYLQERTTNQSSLTTLLVEQGEAMRKKAELQEANDKQLKELSVKSTREQIEEAESQYKIYENFKTVLGKDSADKQKQFAELIKNGHSFTEYLLKQQEKYKAELSKNPEDEKASENLVVTTVKYNEVTGKKTRLQQLTEDITKVKVEAKDLSEVLEKLENYQSGLKGDTSESGRAQSEFLQAEIEDVKKKQLKELDDFLASFEDFENQKTQIATKYANLRKTLTDKYKGDTTSEEYKKELGFINEGEDNALQLIEDKQEERIRKARELAGKIAAISVKSLRDEIEANKKSIESTEVSEIRKAQLRLKNKNLQKQIDERILDSFSKLINAGGQLGGVLSQLNGGFGEAGRLLIGLSQNADGFVNAIKKFKDTGDTTDIISNGVSGLISLSNMLISSASAREKAEEEYRKNALQFEQDYKVAINERIGLEAQSKENVFSKDYVGRIQDGFKKYNDASEKFKIALAKLNQGQAKVGQRNAIDWGNVGSGVGNGAAIGAAIGSAVPIIGTVIGGVIGGIAGGIAGIFGGKKKEDTYASLLKEYPELIQTAADGQKSFNKDLAQMLITNNLVDDATKKLLQDTITWNNQMEAAKAQIKTVISELAGGLGDKLKDSLVNAFKEGTSAAQAFGDSVSSILEDLLSSLIFNAVFKDSLDKLEEDLKKSFESNGDTVAVFGAFMAQKEELTKKFNDALTAANIAAGAAGIKAFEIKKPQGSSALTGSIKSVTEDTANVLAGNITQLRVVATNQLATMRNVQSIAQSQLDLQSKFLPYLERMNSSLEKLNSGDNVLRVKF